MKRVEPTPCFYTWNILTAFWLHFIFNGYNVLQHLPCEGTGDGDFDNRFKSVKQREREQKTNEISKTISFLRLNDEEKSFSCKIVVFFQSDWRWFLALDNNNNAIRM